MSISLEQTDYKNKECVKGVFSFKKINFKYNVSTIVIRLIRIVHFDKDYIKEISS